VQVHNALTRLPALYKNHGSCAHHALAASLWYHPLALSAVASHVALPTAVARMASPHANLCPGCAPHSVAKANFDPEDDIALAESYTGGEARRACNRSAFTLHVPVSPLLLHHVRGNDLGFPSFTCWDSPRLSCARYRDRASKTPRGG
jgi:hypothetical protein